MHINRSTTTAQLEVAQDTRLAKKTKEITETHLLLEKI